MKAKVFMISLFVLNIFQMSAQSNDEVTLVVSADGATKEEATKVALRSAIEQAYGTFVSANTTLLNDEMVKDEIVTISKGNIKDYNEIASIILPNGNQSVTLQATVCISKLVSYAQSKGASTDFAGATFGMNIKMKELNKQNEKKALSNLLVEVEKMLPSCFDKKIYVGNPISQEDGNYRLPILLLYLENENQKSLDKLIQKTLESLSISKEEETELSNMGIETYKYFYDMLHCIVPFYDSNPRGTKIRLRNEAEYYRKNTFGNKLNNLFREEVLNIEIVDNNGNKYEILPLDRKCVYIDRNNGNKVFQQNFPLIEKKSIWDMQKNNIIQEILKNGVAPKRSNNYFSEYNGHEGISLGNDGRLGLWYFKKSGEQYTGGANFLLGFSIGIPKENMMKINNFSVQRNK